MEECPSVIFYLGNCSHWGTEALQQPSSPPCSGSRPACGSCSAGTLQELQSVGWGLGTQAAHLLDKHHSYSCSGCSDGILDKVIAGLLDLQNPGLRGENGHGLKSNPLLGSNRLEAQATGGLQLPIPPTRTTISSTPRAHGSRNLREARRKLKSVRHTACSGPGPGKEDGLPLPDTPRGRGGLNPRGSCREL